MDSPKPKKQIDKALSEYFSGLAKSSHGKIKAKYGGEQGYRAHMREIASRPRKKRQKLYDTPPEIDSSLSTAPPLDDAGNDSVGNESSGIGS